MIKLAECDGIEYYSRKLVIKFETNKSTIPYGSWDVRRRGIKDLSKLAGTTERVI